MPDWQAFGRALMEARVRRGLSRAELARKTGLSLPFVSRLERGQRGVSQPALVELIARVLQMEGEERVRFYLYAANLPEELASLLGREELVGLLAGLMGVRDRAAQEAGMGHVASLGRLLVALSRGA